MTGDAGALRAECIELIRGTGGYPAAIERAVQALGISQTEAQRWVHSLGASEPETLIRIVAQHRTAPT
jgi:hypothetical protein